MERWAGRVAVVTGASAGIGAAIVKDLVKSGMKVVGIARRVEKVEELKAEVKGLPGTLYPFKADVSKEEDVKNAFQWVKEKLGVVDVLINNAGVASASSLSDGPVENWRKIMELNVLGLSMCTKEALQIMYDKGVDDGHIFHINSPGTVRTEIIDASGIKVPGGLTSKEMYDQGPSLESEDISQAVLFVLGAPAHVQIHEITIKPVGEEF
ncbi:Farnesol dehydrogenase [Blattella germanica]|nr:Farnesol dehydrogenase [Blattella germanica]